MTIQQVTAIELRKYRSTHSLKETAARFGYTFTGMTSRLSALGIHGSATIKRQSCPLTMSLCQSEILLGNMLGDGHISKLVEGTRQNSHFTINQRTDRSGYVDDLFRLYEPYSRKISYGKTKRPSFVDGRICHDDTCWDGRYTYWCKLRTVSHPVFSECRRRWYKNPYGKSEKIVPRDIRLSWLTVAIWACDDGTCRKADRAFILHTDSFCRSEVRFLIRRLREDLGVRSSMLFSGINRPIIYIGADNVGGFLDGIAPHMPTCFSYKCDTSSWPVLTNY